MSIRPGLTPLLLLPFLALLGCTSTTDADRVDLTLSARYEQRVLSGTGFAAPSPAPARYCYVEVRDAADESIWASGFLGPDGTATTTLPRGVRVYLKAYAQYEVPSYVADQPFFFRGSVKTGRAVATYANADAFNALPNAAVSGKPVVTEGPTTLSVLATEATRDSGPFAIADQAVAFGLAVKQLAPNLRLPNLHTFWSPSLSSPTPATTYPAVATDGSGRLLRQATGRAIFQHEVRGHATGAAAAGADEQNAGKLLETFAHLLFANYSFPAEGTSYRSILRRDNDPVYVARDVQAESSLAFVDGFCDFLSGAIRNDPSLVDVQPDGSLRSFRLDRHDQFARIAGQGEFYRGSVAISLWGVWQHALGGAPGSGLQQLWAATQGTGSGEYLNAPLGAYPTYLVGLKRLLGEGSSAWATSLTELGLEDIGDVTLPAYFTGPALWTNLAAPPVTATGTLQTYDPAQARYYDRNQGIAHRFTQAAAGNRSFTLTPTGGQDFWIELIGPVGYVLDASGLPLLSAQDTRVNGVPQPRTLTAPNLPPGDYAVRVRAGYTSATLPSAGFSLNIQ